MVFPHEDSLKPLTESQTNVTSAHFTVPLQHTASCSHFRNHLDHRFGSRPRQNAAALLCRARADCCAGAVREVRFIDVVGRVRSAIGTLEQGKLVDTKCDTKWFSFSGVPGLNHASQRVSKCCFHLDSTILENDQQGGEWCIMLYLCSYVLFGKWLFHPNAFFNTAHIPFDQDGLWVLAEHSDGDAQGVG